MSVRGNCGLGKTTYRGQDGEDIHNPEEGSVVCSRDRVVEKIRQDRLSINDETCSLAEVRKDERGVYEEGEGELGKIFSSMAAIIHGSAS